jgi:hypothetical protein
MQARLGDSVSGRYRPEENLLLTKHVVAAGTFVKDAGSTPAASTTITRGFCGNWKLVGDYHKLVGRRRSYAEPNSNGAPNMMGGATNNFVDAGIIGATIASSGAANYSDNVS